MNIYDFEVKDVEEKLVSLAKYKGKVLLIVNTATECGLTPQYNALQTIYEKYSKQGFEVLDFPCNQFLGQAPGSNQEIVEFCQLRYKTTFQTFAKLEVNGDKADPLYVYLKNEQKEDIENTESGAFKKVLHGLGQSLFGEAIKWNFTKFLVNREGQVVARFAPSYTPEEIVSDIEKLLA